MNQNNTFYATVTERNNTIKIEIRDALQGNVKKVFNLPGKVLTPPVVSGNTMSISIQVGTIKKYISYNIKTGSKRERQLS